LHLVFLSVAVALVSVVVIGEVFCRLFFPDIQLRYKSDVDALYYFEPNQKGIQILSNGMPSPPATINELGLRGGRLAGESPRRILVLGDSFTFGAGVADQDTFVAHMDAALGPEFTVINGGQPGYGVFQMKATLDRLADLVKPELVILVIWQGDFLRRPPNVEERNALAKSQAVSRVIKMSVLLTHVYRMIERAIIMWNQRGAAMQRGEGEGSSIRVEQYLEGIENDRDTILSMHEHAKEYGKGLVVVLWTKEGFNLKVPDAEKGLANRLTETLQKTLSHESIPFIALQPSMAVMLTKGQLTIPGDGHPSVLGHCIAAKAILHGLGTLGYAPKQPVSCF